MLRHKTTAASNMEQRVRGRYRQLYDTEIFTNIAN